MRILLIEDELGIAQFISQGLREMSYLGQKNPLQSCGDILTLSINATLDLFLYFA
jgi:hypothetical protein